MNGSVLRLDLVRYAISLPGVGPVLLRPIVPEDRELAAEAFARLSAESRLHRFWMNGPELPPGQLQNLTAAPGKDHVGWVAIDPSPEAEFPAFGAASWWRDGRDPALAEMSFTVADAWQGQGIGTLLLAVLWMEAWQGGIDRLFAVINAANVRAADWFARLGAGVWPGTGQFDVLLALAKPSEVADAAFAEAWRSPASRHRLALCLRALLSQDELTEAGWRMGEGA